MKRIFSILMLFVLLVSALGLSASPASASGLITYVHGVFVWGKGIVFVFEASGFRNRDVRGADIFVGSNFHDLGCTVNKEEGKIICVASAGLTQYAGQTGIVYLAGQIFHVIIPGRSLGTEEAISSLSCPEGTIAGAQVTFETGGGGTFTTFVSGSTRSEVQSNAQSYVDGSDLVGIDSIGDLYCSQEPQ